MAAKKRYKWRRSHNRHGMLLATFAVVLLLTVVSVRSISLLEKRKEYMNREQALTAQIEAENDRSEEIAEFEKYTKTRKYIEEVAKDKLGLVYPGEIIFKDESGER